MHPTLDPAASTFRLQRAGLEIELRRFQPGDETAFRVLNEQWISKFFVLEKKDEEVLRDPVGEILERGGHIFMATAGASRIGTCALLSIAPGAFEVAKMAIEEHFRGEGIGRALLEYTVVEARRMGARRLYLETNNALANAIHLYQSVGFCHLAPERVTASPYARANVFMEKLL
jgi:N-acetylglutamate synthase-like GNAT family acetyltransferase